MMSERDLQERLIGIVQETEWFMRALETVAPRIRVPWCIAAGAVMGLVWNHGTQRRPSHGIKDLDVAYFDPLDLSEERESRLERIIQNAFPDDSPTPDVKNQARVHLWYERVFGYAIQPYDTLETAIASWPTTASAVGVSLRDDVPQIIAPFGLEDLFARRVRPNKRVVGKAIFDGKVRKWRRDWPEIQAIRWDDIGIED